MNEQDDIDNELYAFFYSATDEQELVHDIQRSVDKAKQAITTILDQKIKEARIDEWKLISEVQHSAGITAELYFGEERDNRINQLTKEK